MRVTLAAQLNALASGKIMDSDGLVDSGCFNFYDWFCKDTSLQRKSKTLFGQVKRFLKFGPEVDILNTYVFFKNNCPIKQREATPCHTPKSIQQSPVVQPTVKLRKRLSGILTLRE